MLRVYRWEDSEGVGPYTGRGDSIFTPDAIGDRTFTEKRWPLPNDDGIEHVESNAVFGFSSVAQARAWFNVHERIHLRAHGFRLVVYEVQERFVSHGRRQVCFERYNQDVPVATLPVSEVA